MKWHLSDNYLLLIGLDISDKNKAIYRCYGLVNHDGSIPNNPIIAPEELGANEVETGIVKESNELQSLRSGSRQMTLMLSMETLLRRDGLASSELVFLYKKPGIDEPDLRHVSCCSDCANFSPACVSKDSKIQTTFGFCNELKKEVEDSMTVFVCPSFIVKSYGKKT